MRGLKSSRAASFAAVALVYIVAAAVGILVFRSLDLPLWLALLVADTAATAVTFIFSLIFCNASVYDPYWSVQPPLILIALAFGKRLTVLGVLLIAAVSFWGVRLTANWAYTFRGLEHQDWRYTMLEEKTGAFYPIINFVGIHMVPTLVVYGCILPAAYAIELGLRHNLFSILFVALSFAAAVMQGIADIQMHSFRKRGTGGYINTGLWKYSRHPNYLGEILMWWGIALAVLCVAQDKWYLVSGAVANTLLFFFVSIPMAEQRQARKGGFDEYRSRTRMLLPITRFGK